MRLEHGITLFRHLMATGFSIAFFVLSLALGIATFSAVFEGLTGTIGLTESLLKAINMAVISLATFELGLVINQEYAGKDDKCHIATVLYRTLPRFVSIVCIALVLEGLLMVIKYSQLDMAGNLYYPVAVITSASLLLAALGLFLHLSGYPSSAPVTPSNERQATTTRNISVSNPHTAAS